MSFQPDERGPAGAEEGLPCPKRLANDAVTVRELLAHTGGVDSPPPATLWAGSVADVANMLGPPDGCRRPGRDRAGLALNAELVRSAT
jgi:CubicO group peptidase (beta-lactamase class C family)